MRHLMTYCWAASALMRSTMMAGACLALAACGNSNPGTERDRRTDGIAAQAGATQCDETPRKGRATREEAVEAYLDAVQRGCVEELVALHSPGDLVPDEGKNGHRSTRDELRDMVRFRCGLRLTNREIEWGPKEEYGLDATIEYYDAHFSADLDPSPGRFSRYRDNAHVDHVKTTEGTRWFVDPLIPRDAPKIEPVPDEDRCFPVELMGRIEAIVEARERAGTTAGSAAAAKREIGKLPISGAFRDVVDHEIDQRADDDGDLGMFVAAQPTVVRPSGEGRMFVKAQVLSATEYSDHTWGSSYVWFEADFVNESGEWVIDSLTEEGDANTRFEWSADDQ